MFHPMIKRSIPVALSAALLAGTAAPSVVSYAASSQVTTASNTLFTPASLGKVSIGGGSYIELQNVQKLDNTLLFTIAIVNNGSTDLQFIDYWVKLRSVTGSSFSINITDKDKDKNRIPAKTTETITFYSSVNDNTKLSDLKFDFIKWDFSVASFQRYLGSVRVPATYNNVTPAGKKLNMLVSGNKATGFIKQANVAKTSDEYAVNLSFVIENTGTRSFPLPTYEYSILTSEGLAYPLTAKETSTTPANIYPRVAKEITLKGEIPSTVSNKGWKLVISEKSGETLVLPVATFQVPASTAPEVITSIPLNGKKEIVIEDQKVEAFVSRTIRNENDKNYLAAINFSFMNQGKEPVTLPKYSFSIKTSAGLTYPVTATMDNVRLDPRVEKSVEMKATLPNNVGKTGWKLVMQEPVDSEKPDGAKTTVATFDLPNDNPIGLNQGSTYTYSNSAGSYDIKFDSVQRVPWEDEDILSAEFTVKNAGKTALPVPDLIGYFTLDDKIKIDDVKTLQKDNVIDIKPNGDIHVTLYGKIPYTYEYSTLKVALQEKNGEETPINVVEFSNKGSVKDLPVIAVGNKHSIEGVGRTSEVAIRDVRTYENPSNYFFTTLIDITNIEKRYTNVAALVGYFKTPDDLMYPATITELQKQVAPSGTATIMASADLPKSIDTSKLQLILGEGVAEGKLITKGTSDAYINAVTFNLPSEVKEPKKELKELTLFPYTLSIQNVRSKITTIESFAFTFDYTLAKNTFVELPADHTHKILIQFKDPYGGVSFDTELLLENEEGLKLGSNTFEKIVTDPRILQRLGALETFTVEVYDLFNGQKFLLGTQQFEW